MHSVYPSKYRHKEIASSEKEDGAHHFMKEKLWSNDVENQIARFGHVDVGSDDIFL